MNTGADISNPSYHPRVQIESTRVLAKTTTTTTAAMMALRHMQNGMLLEGCRERRKMDVVGGGRGVQRCAAESPLFLPFTPMHGRLQSFTL